MGLFYFYFFISGFRHSLNPKEPHQSDQTFASPKKSLSRKPSAPSSINKLPACSWQPDGSLIHEGGDSVLLRNYSSWARLPGEPRCLPPGVSSSRRCRSQRSISPAASPPGGGWGAATGSGAELGAVLQTLPRDLWVWDPGNYQPGAVLAGCALATRLVPAAEATDHLRFPPGAGPEQKLM